MWTSVSNNHLFPSPPYFLSLGPIPRGRRRLRRARGRSSVPPCLLSIISPLFRIYNVFLSFHFKENHTWKRSEGDFPSPPTSSFSPSSPLPSSVLLSCGSHVLFPLGESIGVSASQEDEDEWVGSDQHAQGEEEGPIDHPLQGPDQRYLLPLSPPPRPFSIVIFRCSLSLVSFSSSPFLFLDQDVLFLSSWCRLPLLFCDIQIFSFCRCRLLNIFWPGSSLPLPSPPSRWCVSSFSFW